MRNSKVLFHDLVKAITLDEDLDEIQSMVYILMDNILSVSRTDILAEKEIGFRGDEEKRMNDAVSRINSHEPIQYILGETEFYGRKFTVNSHVLIPRPETEELVRTVVDYLKEEGGKAPAVLDIGTGSGCIAITIALEIPDAIVAATDTSTGALDVARENAASLQAKVAFLKHDILGHSLSVKNLNVVVSNPPYITNSEKGDMKSNVVMFEPATALFVPDSNPLLFYEAIVKRATLTLRSGGMIALEINERFGNDVVEVLRNSGFIGVEIQKDVFRKDRIVKGIRQ